jgi:hypothetical protein
MAIIWLLPQGHQQFNFLAKHSCLLCADTPPCAPWLLPRDENISGGQMKWTCPPAGQRSLEVLGTPELEATLLQHLPPYPYLRH